MAECKHYKICGREGIEEADGESWCILHSKNPSKDKEVFEKTLVEHRREKGDNFQCVVFPEGSADFSGTTFTGANFSLATFGEKANFNRARFDANSTFLLSKFSGEVGFVGATFSGESEFVAAAFGAEALFIQTEFNGEANFNSATFEGWAQFIDTRFNSRAVFFRAKFNEMANFSAAIFGGDSDFSGITFGKSMGFNSAIFHGKANLSYTTFSEDAHFAETMFKGEAYFRSAKFNGEAHFSTLFGDKTSFVNATFGKRTVFSYPKKENGISHAIFFETDVDFRSMTIEPLDALVIRHGDLRKCRFVGTDLRKAEFTGGIWPKMEGPFPLIPRRFGVYDEISPQREKNASWYSEIESLYCQLKQNYEERRSFERANDFHYGEKEMRRKNPQTPWQLKIPLLLYWLVSGYGERCLRPLLWAAALLVVCTWAYLWSGLRPNEPKSLLLDWSSWDSALRYSFQTLALLRPTDLVPVGNLAKWIHVLESLIGPLLLGLFALALRQRLKR